MEGRMRGGGTRRGEGTGMFIRGIEFRVRGARFIFESRYRISWGGGGLGVGS